MEHSQSSFPTERERLAAINRTQDEVIDNRDIDIRKIVVRAMEAYSANRIEEINQESLNYNTAKYLREVAYGLTRWGDALSVLIPVVLSFLPLLLILFFLSTDPMTNASVYLAFFVPIGIGIALFFFSISRTKPLSILGAKFAFMSPNSVGTVIVGFLLGGVICGLVTHVQKQSQESRLVSLYSAKQVLVAKSMITMKELTEGNVDKIPTMPATVIFSRDNKMVITTTKQGNSVTHVAEGRNSFSGELQAEVTARYGSVKLTDSTDGSPRVQAQVYSCRYNGSNGNSYQVEVLQDSPTANHSNALMADGKNQSGESAPSRIELVFANGSRISLEIDGTLVNEFNLDPGDILLLAIDPNTKTAIQFEELPRNTR